MYYVGKNECQCVNSNCDCADSLVTTTVVMQWTDKQRAVACRLSPSDSHSRLVAKLPRELFFSQNQNVKFRILNCRYL